MCNVSSIRDASINDYQMQKPRYAVLVTALSNGFELRIPQLLLAVRTTSLEDGYRTLIAWKEEVLACARESRALDNLPSDEPPAILGDTIKARIPLPPFRS